MCIFRGFLFFYALTWTTIAGAQTSSSGKNLVEIWSQYASDRRIRDTSEFGLFFELENALYSPLLRTDESSLLITPEVRAHIQSEAIFVDEAIALAKQNPKEILAKDIVTYTNERGVTEYARLVPFADLSLIAAHNLGFEVALVRDSSARNAALTKFLLIRILALQSVLVPNPPPTLFEVPAWRPGMISREKLGFSSESESQFYLGNPRDLENVSSISHGAPYGDFPNHAAYLRGKSVLPFLPAAEKSLVPPNLTLHIYERLKAFWMLGLAVKARKLYLQNLNSFAPVNSTKSRFHNLPFREIADLLIRDPESHQTLERDHDANVQLLRIGTEVAFGGSTTLEGLQNALLVGTNPLERIVGSIPKRKAEAVSYNGITYHREICRRALTRVAQNPHQDSFEF